MTNDLSKPLVLSKIISSVRHFYAHVLLYMSSICYCESIDVDNNGTY